MRAVVMSYRQLTATTRFRDNKAFYLLRYLFSGKECRISLPGQSSVLQEVRQMTNSFQQEAGSISLCKQLLPLVKQSPLPPPNRYIDIIGCIARRETGEGETRRYNFSLSHNLLTTFASLCAFFAFANNQKSADDKSKSEKKKSEQAKSKPDKKDKREQQDQKDRKTKG
ncbi:hypothetical protein EPA93_46435 [Ktedonosporobacter rubrisoli]|uniref:Uncharacterized protein n=1 Tax=Ktedonosporobacter rubrisoli TaxID=2509675 RepID=A0A4V0Z0F2_KTERU|nr:hypothetical protein [Ktedonosporobacter rubrisoli]QBD83011.1 hypothetical protein EPA93_46435 [Ktedonosporobacter rubrisoli]